MRLSLIITAFALTLPSHADKELPVIHKEDFSKDASAWKTTDDTKWKPVSYTHLTLPTKA